MDRSRVFRTGAAVAVVVLLGTGLRAQTMEYGVQIGALRHPDPGFGVEAMSVGAVTTSESPEGLVRFRVGPFDSYREAQTARSRLRAVGYTGAFIHQMSVPAVASETLAPAPVTVEAPVNTAPVVEAPVAPAPVAEAPVAPAPVAAAPRDAPPKRSNASTLPEEVRVKLVYLGGELHIKEGARFIPLSKYTRGSPE